MAEYETVESYDILIEFDVPEPPPAFAFKKGEILWARRVAPMRKYPGRQARIVRGIETAQRGGGIKSHIKRSLYNHNPREKWTISCRKDDDGTWGIWLTFEGVMTEAEYLKAEVARQERSDEWKRRRLITQAREAVNQTRATLALGRTSYNPSLRPPKVD